MRGSVVSVIKFKHLYKRLDWDILSCFCNFLFSYECMLVCVVPECSPLLLVIGNNVQQEQRPLLSLVPSIALETYIEFD